MEKEENLSNQLKKLTSGNLGAGGTGRVSSSSSTSSQGSPSVSPISLNLERKNSIAKSSAAGKRLQKELMKMVKEPPEGIVVDQQTLEGNDLSTWTVSMSGPANTLYSGENFRLQFKFGAKYPFDSPEVIFIGENIPVHPHVYSNGHICLSILTDDWSPALSVQAVCLSIVSMLASAKEKKRPPDNSFYIKTCHKNPKKTRWWYHDDEV